MTPQAVPAAAERVGRHIPALDGIRGIAIIWVVLHNATAMPFAPASRGWHVLPLLAQPGWIGVQLFFALSGFLITAGLLDSRGSPHFFRDFYAKRALRIVPLYYTVLFVLLVLLPWLARPPAPFSSAHQAPLWFFAANWVESLPYGFAHFWSLAVEEQFYLLWPLVVVGLAPRGLLRACLWIAAGALLLRGALAAYGVASWTLYVNTACRMDALALGAPAPAYCASLSCARRCALTWRCWVWWHSWCFSWVRRSRICTTVSGSVARLWATPCSPARAQRSSRGRR